MYLGIDLGTSNSAIAGNSGGDVRIFKTAEGTDVLPSVIYLDKRGHKFVGGRAYDKILLAPRDVAHGFKRSMGTSTPTVFGAAGVVSSPEECSADVIRTLLAQARAESGAIEIDGAVVTIPAAFNQMQSEATIRAARQAGLDRVGLLQEPIAAAMASMVDTKSRNGQFLVYDLGGGTFDAALIQSSGGTVNVLAHDGINMLGGRDFDRMILDTFVRPWLLENFALPANFQGDPRYAKLAGIARHAAEKAKIDLSSSDRAVIFAGDDEVRLTDDDGADIYLSVDIVRRDLERLIEEPIARSIDLCRKIIRDNGFSYEDIAKVVFIGGPSKTPLVRTIVPRELAVEADLQTDPMTAVAIGAAIFAESRDWSTGAAQRKPSRASTAAAGALDIRYDFPARTSGDQAKIRVRAAAKLADAGYWLKVDTPDGWTSGLIAVDADTEIAVPVVGSGDNHFRVTVCDAAGALVGAASEIAIMRTQATAGGIPAAHTLAVRVIETASGQSRNALEPLVVKSTLLPTTGRKSFRAAKDLRGGKPGRIDIEIFQQAEDVPDSRLNLHIGTFSLDALSHLEPTDTLRRGEEVTVHWRMDDNGLLACSVEIPSLGRLLDVQNFYTPEAGHQNFDGKEGRTLVASAIDEAEADLDAFALQNPSSAAAIEPLRRRLDDQRTKAAHADGGDRRSAVDGALAIRQQIAKIRNAPENRAEALLGDLLQLRQAYDTHIRDAAHPALTDLMDRLAGTTQQAIKRDDFPAAERAIGDMKSIYHRELWRRPDFVVAAFKRLSDERHLAADPAAHDRLAAEGQRLIADNQIDRLRRVISDLFDNRRPSDGADSSLAAFADLMRG